MGEVRSSESHSGILQQLSIGFGQQLDLAGIGGEQENMIADPVTYPLSKASTFFPFSLGLKANRYSTLENGTGSSPSPQETPEKKSSSVTLKLVGGSYNITGNNMVLNGNPKVEHEMTGPRRRVTVTGAPPTIMEDGSVGPAPVSQKPPQSDRRRRITLVGPAPVMGADGILRAADEAPVAPPLSSQLVLAGNESPPTISEDAELSTSALSTSNERRRRATVAGISPEAMQHSPLNTAQADTAVTETPQRKLSWSGLQGMISRAVGGGADTQDHAHSGVGMFGGTLTEKLTTQLSSMNQPFKDHKLEGGSKAPCRIRRAEMNMFAPSSM